jgi:hypothetical protein
VTDLRELLGLPRSSPETFDALVFTRHHSRREADEDAEIEQRRARLNQLMRGA